MPIVGLNLGKSGFKAVELDKKKDSYVINRFGILDNTELDLFSDKKDDKRNYTRALESFMNDHGFTTRNTVVGLDESNVYMRIVKFPIMKDKELANAIKFEAEQYIPLPADEITMTYEKIQGGYIEKDKTLVQLVAAKKSVLESYVHVIKGARLNIKAIEPEAIALGRLLGDTTANPLGTVIIDIGYSRTLVVVVYGGTVQFTRTVTIGGDVISKTIKQGLNLDIEQAEEYKKVYGMDPQYADGRVFEVIKPLVEQILADVRRASVFFTNNNPSASIKKVVLTGGSAIMPGLLLYVATNLDYEVQLANPLSRMSISPQILNDKKMLDEKAPVLSIALGLAMKEL